MLVMHQLQVVAVAEDVSIPTGSLPSLGQVAARSQNIPCQLARQTPGENDDPLRVLGQQIAVDARPIVETLEVRFRGELQQISVTRQILGEQSDVRLRTARRAFCCCPFVP